MQSPCSLANGLCLPTSPCDREYATNARAGRIRIWNNSFDKGPHAGLAFG